MYRELVRNALEAPARLGIERLDLCKADGASMADSALLRPNEEAVFRFRLVAAGNHPQCRTGRVEFPAYGAADIWGDNNLKRGPDSRS